jgi:hypothetical protein
MIATCVPRVTFPNTGQAAGAHRYAPQVPVDLAAEIEPVPGAAEVGDGWRGLIDFGERWAQSDREVWSPEWGELPLGEPLVYGCEVERDPGGNRRVTIRLMMVDERREAMKPGAAFSLRDGPLARATGTLR